MTFLSSQEKPLKNLQILLVEDEADIAELLAVILEQAGAEVIQTSYAVEAFEMLESCQPDILISNVRLPDHNGDWLIQHIRACEDALKSIPAIAVTSYTREFTKQRILNAGFQRFITKPFDPDELIAAVLTLTKSKETGLKTGSDRQ